MQTDRQSSDNSRSSAWQRPIELPAGIPREKLSDLLQASDDIMKSIFHGSKQNTLDTVVLSVKELLNAEAAAIFLVPEDSPDEIELAAYKLDKQWEGRKIRRKIQNVPKGGLVGFIAKTKDILTLHGEGLKNHPNNAGSAMTHLKSDMCYSLLGIPLIDRKDRVLGVVKVDNKKGADGKASRDVCFDDVDVYISVMLLNKIVLVLQSLRYFESLRTLMGAMVRPQRLEEMLDKILKTGLKLIGADRGDFVWWDSSKRQLITRAQDGPGILEIGAGLPERGVSYDVWRTRHPALYKNVQEELGDEDYYNVWKLAKSEVAVCLEFQGKAIGVLNAESAKPNWFDQQDVDLLQLLAHYATIAAQVIEEGEAFRDIVLLVTEHAPSRKEILTDILKSVGKYGFDGGIIYFADHAVRKLRCFACIGYDDKRIDPEGLTYEFDDTSIATWVLHNEKGYFSPDPKSDPEADQERLKVFQIESSLVGVPLIYRDKVVGVLLSWSRHETPPKEDDIERLEPLARLAATTIAVSESERQRKMVLTKIGVILNQMQSETSSEKNLQPILSGIQEAGFDRVQVFKLLEEDTGASVGWLSVGMEDARAFEGSAIPGEGNPYANYASEVRSVDTRARLDYKRFESFDAAGTHGDNPNAARATVPLVTYGKLYGYIATDNEPTGREITQDSLDYLTLFGALAGQAIANQQTIDTLRGSKIRDDFLQRMGHTFNTNTASVKLLVKNIQSGGLSYERVINDYLPAVVKVNQRFLALGQKIRHFARLRDDARLDIEEADLIGIVQDATERLRGPSDAKRIRLVIDSPQSPLYWKLDKTLTASAVEALLENAIKFSPERKAIFVHIQADEQTAKVTVRDEGSGIPDEDLRFVFDTFHRGRNAIDPHVEGEGLGLSIVLRTMELHGGKAKVRNHSLGGAEFTLLFPRELRGEIHE